MAEKWNSEIKWWMECIEFGQCTVQICPQICKKGTGRQYPNMNLLRAIVCVKHLYNSLNPVMFHFLHNCPCSLMPYYVYAQVSRCCVHVLSLGFHDHIILTLTPWHSQAISFVYNTISSTLWPKMLILQGLGSPATGKPSQTPQLWASFPSSVPSWLPRFPCYGTYHLVS